MQLDEIRHRPDGSIDFDFYRAKAHTLRARAIQDFFRTISSRRAALIVAAALAVAALVLAPLHVSDLTSGIRKALEAASEIG